MCNLIKSKMFPVQCSRDLLIILIQNSALFLFIFHLTVAVDRNPFNLIILHFISHIKTIILVLLSLMISLLTATVN